MNSQNLKTFLKVVETGSFSKTAEELNITQSAISHRIKHLEDHYGCTLMDRSVQPFKATECGKILEKKARQILLLEQELTSEIKNNSGKTTLNVCATATYGAFYLPKVVARFLRQTPETVDLNSMLLTPAEAIKGLQNTSFDIGIIEHLQPLTIEECKCIFLPQDEMIFISSPGLGMATQDITVNELLQQRLITRKEGCSCRDLLDHNLKANNISTANFRSTLIYDDLPQIVQTVINGGGIAFVSRCIVLEALQQGHLHAHKVNGFSHSRLRTVVIRTAKDTDPLVSLFSSCLFDEMKEHQKCQEKTN